MRRERKSAEIAKKCGTGGVILAPRNDQNDTRFLITNTPKTTWIFFWLLMLDT